MSGGWRSNGQKTSRRREKLRIRLFEQQGGRCWLCGRLMLFGKQGQREKPFHATFDHLKPKSQGGTMGVANLKLAHKACNVLRGRNESVTRIEPAVMMEYVRRGSSWGRGSNRFGPPPSLRVSLMSLSEPDLIRPATPA